MTNQIRGNEMDMVYVVKYETEETDISCGQEVVYVTKNRDKAEEIVKTFVKEVCWIDEYREDMLYYGFTYPMETIIPDYAEVN